MGIFGKKQEAEEVNVVESVVTPEPVVEPEPQPVKEKVTTVIGEGITIIGDFIAKEDISILGTIKGNVQSEHHLMIAKTGHLEGNAKVNTLDSDGQIKGELHVAATTKLGAHSSYVGTLHTSTITVEDGAEFDGQLKLGHAKKVEAPVEEKVEDKAE